MSVMASLASALPRPAAHFSNTVLGKQGYKRDASANSQLNHMSKPTATTHSNGRMDLPLDT